MNIKQLTKLVPVSFECEVMDDDGNFSRATVNIKLNRFSFREATQKEFTDALTNVDKDPEVIGGLLAKIIAEWEIFEDEENTQMLSITVSNIIDRPVDFVLALAEAVTSKLFPNPQKAENSGSGSAPTAKLAIAATSSGGDTTSHTLPDSGE